MSKGNRGPAPNELTKMKLCAITAGRCQYCNKFLFTDKFSLEDNNDSNLAHIIASSPDGPRGDDKLSHELSNKIENLMLMCLEHHHLIDNKPEIFTIELLKQIKERSERQIAQYGKMLEMEETNIVMFRSPIKNKIKVTHSLSKIGEAIFLKRKPRDIDGVDINIESKKDYNSEEYWKEVDQALDYEFHDKIKRILERYPISHFSIFPIGPIPLIIKLGHLFGDKVPHEIYQYFRGKETWKWTQIKKTNEFEVKKYKISGGNGIALVMSLTGEIDIKRLKGIGNIGEVYEIASKVHGVDCISSNDDLNDFWHIYQSVCEDIVKNHNSVKEISLFPAIPVSAAFSIGSRYMQGVYPRIVIYDDNDGFKKTISIGEKI